MFAAHHKVFEVSVVGNPHFHSGKKAKEQNGSAFNGSINMVLVDG